MRQYEVTFIIDPVLSSEEIKQTAEMYIEHLKSQGCEIVHIQEWGIRQLTYAIKKRSSGAYYTVEFKNGEDFDLITKLELAFRRDERILRFLTIKLDKYGVQYNSDKRAGLIGKKKKEEAAEETEAKAEETAKAE